MSLLRHDLRNDLHSIGIQLTRLRQHIAPLQGGAAAKATACCDKIEKAYHAMAARLASEIEPPSGTAEKV